MKMISVLAFLCVLSTVCFSQNPCPGIPTITYEGKIYNTVQIGNQCWLKENLNVGSMINSKKTSSYNAIIEKYCYEDDTNNCNIYGGLYKWNEAMQYATIPRSKGICPDNWHIPTLDEFQTLKTNVNNSAIALKANGQGIKTGEKKDSSGFSALLGGFRYKDDVMISNSLFYDLNYNTYFWSSTEYGGTYAYYMYIGDDFDNIFIGHRDYKKDYGFNIRCIKD